jgi:Ca2+-binding EF-hand superfamily protein
MSTTVVQKAFMGALKKPKSEKKVKASFDLIDQNKDGKHEKADWTTDAMLSTLKAVVGNLLHEPKKNNVSVALRGVLASFFETIDYKDLAETLFTMTDSEKKGHLEYSDFQVSVFLLSDFLPSRRLYCTGPREKTNS